MDLQEGVGESSSPERSCGGFGGYDIRNDVYNRLLESGNEEVTSNLEFREQLDAHFSRLPMSYAMDFNTDRVEDVLLHQKILTRARDPENRPVFHIRFLENFWNRGDDIEDEPISSSRSDAKQSASTDNEGALLPRDRNFVNEFEPCSKLEDLNLDVRNSNDLERGTSAEDFTRRQEVSKLPIHEVIFSTIDKPKLLSQLSSLLSDIGLNIREAHIFSTTDRYSLDVFVVDGWPVEDTEDLNEAMKKAIARNEGSWSDSSRSQSVAEKTIAVQAKSRDWELDRKLIKMGDKIASGSCGQLYRGVYIGQDVAVKVLRSEHLNSTLEDEFAQEITILREVQHENIVQFIGACTKYPPYCIVTEYMPGGSLYDFLRKDHIVLNLSQLLRFAIDICKGMEYLHEKNIIHRDLKAANLLLDSAEVVKVADFGVARFQHVEGVMTAETGTYRWMAPEVLSHQPYDQKADVFSFGIVLWELLTIKVPYEDLSPLQAAIGVVKQGLRPELPKNTHPKLSNLMQRCWEAIPANRPSFSQIRVELEELLEDESNSS